MASGSERAVLMRGMKANHLGAGRYIRGCHRASTLNNVGYREGMVSLIDCAISLTAAISTVSTALVSLGVNNY